jgi:DNA-3-methyladenine glycosylase
MIIPTSFYQHDDVAGISRQLLGKVLCTVIEGYLTTGIITETEAYAGKTDKASHAYNGRRTARTEIMFRNGGISYVYLCYGIHSLFNVVTSTEGNPHAVLIRAIIPLEGKEVMQQRQEGRALGRDSGTGPGRLSSLLGIHFVHTGLPLEKAVDKNKVAIWIEDRNFVVKEDMIISGPRIGVDYAGEDALLPYRFRVLNFRY